MTDNVDVIVDVIVVGAGPGGSAAAASAARMGLKTLLLDREQFPRDKACGDAIPLKTFHVMRDMGIQSFDPDMFYRVNNLRIQSPRGISLNLELMQEPDASPCITSRYEFDQFLFQHAVNCGAVSQQVNVTGLLMDKDQVVGVKGRAGRKTVELCSKIVIAADGATSVIARELNGTRQNDANWAVALRGYVETDVDIEPTIEFAFLDKIQPGYAWFFPAGCRSVNIGVGMRSDFYKRQDKSLKDALDYYVNTPPIKKLIGSHKVENVKSWQLPLFNFEMKRVFNGAMLIGDAGGFVDPVVGAGIYTAMVTGCCAAQAAVQAVKTGDFSEVGLALYERLWKQELESDLGRAVKLHNLLVPMPVLVDGLLLVGKVFPSLITRLVGKF